MSSKSKRKLTKSASDRLLTGSIGGFGKFFGVNANYLRIAFVILTAITHFFPGILIYILLVAILPADPNKPSFSSMFRGFTAGQANEPEKNKERKVIHDVDEHDES